MEQPVRPSGRISFAAVPFDEPPWYKALLAPLVVLSNALLVLWIYPCWRTTSIRWSPALDGLKALMQDTNRSLIFYSWHKYEPLVVCALRDFPPELQPTGIGHDGVLSRMLQRAIVWFGFRVWVYRRKSPVRPRQQIAEMIKERRCNVGLFADAGGPYGKVKPGLAEIARATEAWLVPVVVRGHPTLRFRWPRRYAFPLPFCKLAAYHGEPIDGSDATVERCQQALEATEARSNRT